MNSDQQIQRDVLAELGWDARVAPNEVGRIRQETAPSTLSGQVESYTKKWAAEGRRAPRGAGSGAVANDVEVKLPYDDQRTDPDICRGGGQRPSSGTHFIPSDKVQATISKGWVTLKGDGRLAVPEGSGRTRGAQTSRGSSG